MMKTVLAVSAIVLGLLQTASAQNQYSNWLYSGSIYILTSPAGANLPGSASENNFPLLVRLNTDFFNFSQAKSDGSDVRFTTGAGTNLSYQIDEWNSAGGTASIWVLVPTIKGNTNQQIIMYWGKSDATSASSGPAVFSSTNGYVSVLHMTDPTKDAVGTLVPVNSGTTAGTGMIGPARHFVSGQGINCGTSITTLPTGANSNSSAVWFRADGANSTLVGWGIEQGQGKVVMQLVSPPHIRMDCYFSGADVTGGSTLAQSQWYHVVHTYKNGEARLYVNGVQDGITTGGTALNIPTPSRMYIGGWWGSYNFAGDVDEVRISKVTRSANWVKMEYEDQKPLQTMTGILVPPGSTFSVSPAAVTMNEGTTTNVTAQAGGAQKVYWISKSGGKETIISVDRLSCTVAAGRVTGDQSFVLQFKGVYPTGIQTNDIPINITEYLPDPAFTLTASTNLWDGRQTMTVTANVTNLSALQAKGVANLTYAWSVAGVAVTKTIANPTLTLLRSQGSGPMTVTLVMNNGGALITNTVVVTVQEPATDAWVVRTPGSTEKAVNNQFYARDDTGYGTIYYNGTGAGSPDHVFLKVFTNGPTGDVLYTNLTQVPSGGAYAFSVRIPSGLVKYSVQCGSVTGTTTNSLGTATNLVCGDAYIIEGQSNAVATDSLPSETTTSPWIRSYGWSGGGWGSAVRNGTQWWIGYWGMDLATNLVASYNMPICIINGAVGGTRIDQHQANPANHYVADSYGNTIYANLLNRVAGANLTHGIRAILWHQGENNSAADSPTGTWDYLSYQQYFVDMSAAWKQDYPNVRHYNIFQVCPNPCSMGGKESADMLREVQRTLPHLFSNMSVMSTLGLSGYLGCHFSAAGYTQIATLIAPLVKQDNYGFVPTSAITAPDVKRAYFTTTSSNQIALEFGQDMVWNTSAPGNFYLDRVGSRVTSGSASGKVIKLQVTGATTNRTIDYVVDQFWGGSSANLLKGSNGIAVLTFYAVPIASPPVCTLTNLPATGITTNSAALNATLACTGTVYNVVAYWNTVNGGTSAALWTNSAYLGAWGDSVSTNLTYPAMGLAPNRTYYFTFRATNAVYDVWGNTVRTFTTLTPPGPGVDNDGGAANLSPGVTQLRGMLANGPANVRLYWGTTDGGTNGPWANTNFLTGAASGAFSATVSNLLYGVTYYYRTYASNQWGTAWAPATASFTTLRPASSLANSAATGVASTAAAINATLACTGAVYDVVAYWNTVSSGTDPAQWTNSAYVGTWSDVASTNLSFPVTGLAPGTPYYFTFLAANALDALWATNVQSFTTLPPPLVISGMTYAGGGMAAIAGTGAAGQTFVLMQSPDLAGPSSSWTPVQTNSDGNGVFNFSIPVGPEPSVYFRVFAY